MRHLDKPSLGRLSAVLVLVPALVLLAPLPAAAQDDDGGGESEGIVPREGLSFVDTGPIRVREQFLLSAAYLAFEPVSADVLAPGQWQVDAAFSVTNTWARSGSVQRALEGRVERRPLTLEQLRALEPQGDDRGIVFADGELSRLSMSLRRGLGDDVHLVVNVPVLSVGGGVGDRLIQSFHDTFGFQQNGRDGVPEDAYTVYLRDEDGDELFRRREPGAGLGDVSVGLKYRLGGARDDVKWAVEGLVKAPTGDEEDLYGSGAWDAGLQLITTRYYDRSCLHLAAGALYLGESDVYGTDAQVVLSGMAGYEYALGSSTSAVAQLTVSQSPFRDLGVDRLDEIAVLVDLGIKHGLSRQTVLFFAVSENLVNFSNSADFGIHAGLTYTL